MAGLSFILLAGLSILGGSEVLAFKYLPEGVNQIQVGNIKLQESGEPGKGIIFAIDANGTLGLEGQLGVALPHALDNAATNCDPGEADLCLEWGDYAKLSVTSGKTSNGNCARVQWITRYGKRLEDCFDLISGHHWYGGLQVWYQTYPYETQDKTEMPNVAGAGYGGVNENYWFTTQGFGIHVDEDVPLFSSLNTVHPNQFCLVAKDVAPFVPRGEVQLNYDLCGVLPQENLRDVHVRTLQKYYGRPTTTPDLTMMLKPFWSTWAEYHADVNERVVLEYAQRILDEGFLSNSHVEIDDHWETCYGDAVFDPAKFPDPAGLVKKLKEMGFKVTLWIHPFINHNCPAFKTAFERNYFVRDVKDKPAIVSWWNSNRAGIIDFTNEEAVAWWTGRLDKLRNDYGIDSFKFDAGEFDSLPASVKMVGSDSKLVPNSHTTRYVEAVAKFGDLIEVRVGRRTQNQGIFARMIDKDSRWGYDNGLQSLIPTLLHFSMLGYPFCLPDMIGGNAYQGRPSKELYIRWMQANVLMPAVQISLVPWNYDEETVKLTQEVLAVREDLSIFLELAINQTLIDGLPINRPLWFIDPDDTNFYEMDDQYVLLDGIIVAPMLEEGGTYRDIYLPKGTWVDYYTQEPFTGPAVVEYNVPMNIVPIFIEANLYETHRHRLRR